MIDLIYTTKAKQQRRFNLRTGYSDFEYTISKSSIVREIRTFKYYSYSSDQTVSLQTYIDGGVDIKFEGTIPVDAAIIKLLPYDQTPYTIFQIYGDLLRLEEKNPSLYAVIEMNLLADKYNDIYELFDDIRELHKKSAVNMLSFYQPMIGYFPRKSYDYGPKDYSVPKEALYENIEQIEAAIRKEYGTRVFGDGYVLCPTQYDNTLVAEYHADIVKKLPYVRTDFYFKKPLTIEEISNLKEALCDRVAGFNVRLRLPELGRADIYADNESIFTTEEMNQKYFNN